MSTPISSDGDPPVDVERPFCSVLSTVVSHMMSPPTPLEPEELQESLDSNNKTTISVPILRVFGPIVRGDAPSGQDPVQSACLYIHGAFPYLLARPATAGPDGSLHHSSHLFSTTTTNDNYKSSGSDQTVPSLNSTNSGHIDWDNEQAVDKITSTVKTNLEATLQASMANTSDNSNDNDGKEKAAVPATRFIRKVTVVVGRGFYTYCPGPPAPFLRVEYYDPKMRWKVKLMLERGLEVPHIFHPDPQQYEAVGMAPATDSSQLGLEPLVFRCYEAHIPYTMQFFKDWNLSARDANGYYRGVHIVGMAYIHLSDGKFRRQLPRGVVRRWKNQKDSVSGGGDSDEHSQSSDVSSSLAFLSGNTPDDRIWSSQGHHSDSDPESISGLEIKHPEINNEEKVSTNLSTSLRRSTTLEPFWVKKETSCDVEIDVYVTDMLNVKSIMKAMPENEGDSKNIHWRAVPSLREIWLEERRRMAKLLATKDDFLSRQSAQEGEKSPLPFTLSVKKDASSPGAMLAAKGMKRLLNVSNGLEEEFVRATREIVVRHSSAISRVDRLLYATPKAPNFAGETSSGKSIESEKVTRSTPEVDDFMNALGALGSQFDDGVLSSSQASGSVNVAANETFLTPSQATPLRTRLESTPLDFFSYEMTTDDDIRNPSHLSTGQSALKDREYELLSQKLDRGESILKGRFQNAEDFINPETLAPYDSQEEDGDDVSDDEMDEEGMERVLTALATQQDYMRDDNCVGSIEHNNHDKAQETPTPMQERVESDAKSYSSTSLADDDDDDDESNSGKSDSSSIKEPTNSVPVVEQQVQDPPDFFKTENMQPPSRGSLQDSSTRLLPLSAKDDHLALSWLGHAANYQSFRDNTDAQIKWRPQNADAKTGYYIQPTQPAPRRDELEFWCQKEKKRKLSREIPSGGKEQRTATIKKARDVASALLSVDDNTGKVVRRDDVEEVHWEASQSQAISLTQEAKHDMIKAVIGIPEAEASSPSMMDSQTMIKIGADLSSVTQDISARPEEINALRGMQNQGGKLVVEGVGQLKARTRPSQPCQSTRQGSNGPSKSGKGDRYLPMCLTMMSIEIHVQCRTGRAGVNNANIIAMTPDPERDKISAIAYVFGRDPGGGEALRILERGCIFVPLEQTLKAKEEIPPDRLEASMPRKILGVSSPLSIETAKDEKQLLLRLASLVRRKDPDLLVSWDPQGAGLGYIIERGTNLGNNDQASEKSGNGQSSKLDMARLLGRVPRANEQHEGNGSNRKAFFEKESESSLGLGQGKGGKQQPKWTGSGLGSDWDDRVGAGVAASSIAGRLVLAGWKIVAEEVKHPNYSSLGAMVSTVLSARIPFHDELVLANWFACMNGLERWRVLHYRLVQSTATLLLFDALDIIGRAGEAARLSGVEFSHSFPGIRGSQYKVEGVLLRALKSLSSEERGAKRGEQKVRTEGVSATSLSDETKSQAASPWKKRRKAASSRMAKSNPNCGYFFYSPSVNDTNKQEALEAQALTLEPQSGHQADPVVVCDFTALYPSLVIAYNLCYSTCAGRLSYHTTRREMRREGRTTGRVGPFVYSEGRTATVLKHHMKSCGKENQEGSGMSPKDRAYVAPTGAIFVSESVVRGVLPQVLDELLSTRAMLKKAAKEYKKRVPNLAPSILRQLEARQLALKYVANVTYGYTSATFSGRCAMPILADSIVECGRRTLTNAINLANSWGRDTRGRWYGCEVLYGDTDSLFIKLPGRSVDEAFDFGEIFCKTVTSLNPPPVQLKLEKVYLGSILQTKKKYCGMKFESREAKTPDFEAKGLETIRRDQCALTQKILRNSLIMLFRHGVQAVKEYLFRQWSLIISGQLPASDFVLTGRVRSRYRGTGPVQATLHRRLAEADPGRVMRHKERLSYVIVATPGTNFRLRDCVLTPLELLAQWDSYTLFSTYYIEKHVNASLQRCFGLAPHFIDIKTWYAECPKPRRRIHFWPVTRTGSSSMISAYFGSDRCSLCGDKCMSQGRDRAVVCHKCKLDNMHVTLVSSRRLQKAQQDALAAAKVCTNCNLCYEDPGTFAPVTSPDDTGRASKSSMYKAKGLGKQEIAIPIAACTSIDCPNTFKRHRLREETLEAEAICKALNIET